MNAFLTLLDPAILPFMSLYHFIHPVKSTTPALMVALWPQAVGPSPNGRPRKVRPASSGRHRGQARSRGGPLPSCGDAQGRSKGGLSSRAQEPGCPRLPRALRIPPSSPWNQGPAAGEPVHRRREDASRTGVSRRSHSALGLRSRRSRPLPSPEPAGAGVEAGSRSFVFVSRKDSDYRSAVRACSPGNLSALYPAFKGLPPTRPSSSPGQVRDLGKEGQRAPA